MSRRRYGRSDFRVPWARARVVATGRRAAAKGARRSRRVVRTAVNEINGLRAVAVWGEGGDVTSIRERGSGLKRRTPLRRAPGALSPAATTTPPLPLLGRVYVI